MPIYNTGANFNSMILNADLQYLTKADVCIHLKKKQNSFLSLSLSLL